MHLKTFNKLLQSTYHSCRHLDIGLDEGPRLQSFNCLLLYCNSDALSPSGTFHHLSEKALEFLMFFPETTQDQYSNSYWEPLGAGLITLRSVSRWLRSPKRWDPPDPVQNKMKKITSAFNLLLELPFSSCCC